MQNVEWGVLLSNSSYFGAQMLLLCNVQSFKVGDHSEILLGCGDFSIFAGEIWVLPQSEARQNLGAPLIQGLAKSGCPTPPRVGRIWVPTRYIIF